MVCTCSINILVERLYTQLISFDLLKNILYSNINEISIFDTLVAFFNLFVTVL